MSVLVVGGAGYIGAHVVAQLLAENLNVVVADDLSAGAADRIGSVPLTRIDVADPHAPESLADCMAAHRVDSVIHLAAKKQVGESVADPLRYYRNNVVGLLNLLDAMTAAGVTRIIFSSSAAVYGAPHQASVDEDAATVPVNPYGTTKLIGEQMLSDWAASRAIDWIALRYFNVAGAASPRLADTGVTNLIPMVIDRLLRGEAPRIFGADYDTPDGTCIRDYVHVVDLARAHVHACRALATGAPHHIYNVGTGRGASVLEVINAVQRVAGLSIAPIVEPRRAGDPPVVIAASGRIRTDLGFRTRLGLSEIVASAWAARQPQ